MKDIKDLKDEEKGLINNKPNIRIEFDSTKANSLSWRLWHSINYMIGGITFYLGSYCYFSFINNVYPNSFIIGAWLYSIGSLCFLLADITEWNHFKYGCSCNVNYEGEQTFYNTFIRAEVGINFFFSVLGSLMYLIGSIFFIPSLDKLPLGEFFFIYGSLVIFFSQLWKCLRPHLIHGFKIENVTEDFSGFLVDLCAGLGGFSYFYGTVIFRYMENEYDQNIASSWFVTGGTFFTLSGLAMQYRYYLEPNNKKE